MNKIFQINNLSVILKKKTIINDICLSIDKNEIIGLLGPNGAGKTTTIKACAGLINKKGTISAFGYDIDNDYEKYISSVSFGFDRANYYQQLSGLENLKLFARLYKSCDKKKLLNCVELVGLSNRINDKVSEYSFGMKQRLNFAKALLQNAKLVFLDEPLNGIDPEGIIEFRNLIKSIRLEYDTAFVVSSHLLNELECISDRLVFFSNGNIVDDISIKNNNYFNHYIKVNNSHVAYETLSKCEFDVKIENKNTIKISGEDVLLNKCIDIMYKNNILFSNIESKRNIEEMYINKVGGKKVV